MTSGASQPTLVLFPAGRNPSPGFIASRDPNVIRVVDVPRLGIHNDVRETTASRIPVWDYEEGDIFGLELERRWIPAPSDAPFAFVEPLSLDSQGTIDQLPRI